MKRILLFLALFFGLGSVAVGQDTVRYGDPWYAFNTLPTQNEHQVYQSMPRLTYMFSNLRSYLGFENNDYTIYGIAVTMDSIPGPEWGFLALLLRGMEYHECPPYMLPGLALIDSLYQEDSIKTWEDHVVKRCTFEYFRDYDEILDTFQSRVSSNCYEFYFPTPIKGGFADTFFVAIHACHLDTAQYDTLPVYYGPNILSWPTDYMPIPVTAQLEYRINSRPYTLRAYDAPTFHPAHIGGQGSFYDSRVWGGIFPIIAPRCSVPRGLALTADSLAAWWPADGDAQNYEVAVCTDTVSPDDGLILTTDSTLIALPPLSPDSTYRIYFRKECGFGNYAVWSDWSAPLVVDSIPRVVDSIPDTPDPNGIDSATLGSHVSLSPNPTTGNVHIHSDYVMTRLDIYDTEGRHLDFYAYPGRDADLDLSNYAPSLYHLVISTPQGRTTKQVIKE